jgi:ribosomal protein L14E/L6E/L27E
MSDLLAFETVPCDQLCPCVTVELTAEQARLIDAWPDKTPVIVASAMAKGQQRHVDGECLICNATGISPADKIIADVLAMSDEEVSAELKAAGIDPNAVIAKCNKLVAELAAEHNAKTMDTNMPEQKAKNVSEVASKFESLMGNESSSGFFNQALDKAARLMLEAQSHLVARGFTESDAMSKVKSNFDRCNSSGQVVTLVELCK